MTSQKRTSKFWSVMEYADFVGDVTVSTLWKDTSTVINSLTLALSTGANFTGWIKIYKFID